MKLKMYIILQIFIKKLKLKIFFIICYFLTTFSKKNCFNVIVFVVRCVSNFEKTKIILYIICHKYVSCLRVTVCEVFTEAGRNNILHSINISCVKVIIQFCSVIVRQETKNERKKNSIK